MKLKKIKETKNDLGNGILSKTITFAPENNNQLLTYKQIRDFVENQKKKLPFGSKILVRALNIEKNSTLYSSYVDHWKTNEEWDDYLQGKAKEADKYKYFYNFTIDIN